MSTGAIIIVIVAAGILVAALAVGFARTRGNGRSRLLRRRFGPEYELTVAHHSGDTKAAERELDERLRRHGDLKTEALPGEARERYVSGWHGVQEEFIDAPARAVTDADELLDRLVRDRGYPSDAYEEQVEALSVHHAHSVQGYRQIHTAAARARDGRADTEEMREAVVHARGFFEELVKPPSHDASHHGHQWSGAGGTTGMGRSKGRLGARLHAPWAMRNGGGERRYGA